MCVPWYSHLRAYDRFGEISYGQPSKVFGALKRILQGLGLPLNEKKVFAPCTNLNIMSIVVDIQAHTLSISEEKLHENFQKCIDMFLRLRFTKQELSSLLGKLLHIFRCISGSGRFQNQMLQTLRNNHDNNGIYPDDTFTWTSGGSYD